jgi:3-oxoacyl-[acyl-carrier protein] reductase
MSTNSKPLDGKVALVTGGSRGIGAAIAKRLAIDGAAVAITYSNAEQSAEEVVRSIESKGGQALAIQADNTDADAVKNAVIQTVRTFNGLDVLVNNAGIAIFKPLDELSVDEFDRIVAVNVRAVFVAAQEAARYMKEGGRIITIGSINATRMPVVGGSIYGMSKAAVAGLTRGLARDLGPRGITVNVVQPGPIDTDMNPANGPFAETLTPFLAIKRYGHGDEVAGMVSYLASADGAYVTGAALTIDGGFGI